VYCKTTIKCSLNLPAKSSNIRSPTNSKPVLRYNSHLASSSSKLLQTQSHSKTIALNPLNLPSLLQGSDTKLMENIELSGETEIQIVVHKFSCLLFLIGLDRVSGKAVPIGLSFSPTPLTCIFTLDPYYPTSLFSSLFGQNIFSYIPL